MNGMRSLTAGATLLTALAATASMAQAPGARWNERAGDRRMPQPPPWASMQPGREMRTGPMPFSGKQGGMQGNRMDTRQQAMQRRAMAQEFMRRNPEIARRLQQNPELREQLRDPRMNRSPDRMSDRSRGPQCGSCDCPRCPFRSLRQPRAQSPAQAPRPPKAMKSPCPMNRSDSRMPGPEMQSRPPAGGKGCPAIKDGPRPDKQGPGSKAERSTSKSKPDARSDSSKSPRRPQSRKPAT